MMRELLLLVFVLAFAIEANCEISDDQFRTLHKELQPGDDELWRTIPWKTSILDAQQSAGEQRKPIFVWAMDGHPLGCT